MKNLRSRLIQAGLATVVSGIGAVMMTMLAPAAHADDVYFVPEPDTFVVGQLVGIPGYTPVMASGAEYWATFDAASSQLQAHALYGLDTFTQFGSFTNDFLGVDTGSSDFYSNIVDYANFGGGYANEFVNFMSGFGDYQPGVSDLLITPFGNFELFGNFFANLASDLMVS